MTATQPPVVVLAYANDWVDPARHLRNVSEEVRLIREALRPAEESGLCEVLYEVNVTPERVFAVFQSPRFRNRIAIFHYAGHADGDHVLLESASGGHAVAHAAGLAAFLGEQPGLQLVFLNGCTTARQVEGLLNANCAAVIATSRPIGDTVAMDLAVDFYRGLAGGTGLESAFNAAAAASRTRHGDNLRSLGDAELASEVGRWPWALSINPGADPVRHWNLPEAAGDPLFGLSPLPRLDLPESPFRNLSQFEREHAEVFFGRAADIRRIHDRVTSPDAPPIMLLYGQSGIGKSSVLAAGVLPRLESSHSVHYLRRDAEVGLLGTLMKPLAAAEGEGLDAAQTWRQAEAAAGKPLLLMLDQAEEVFTRPGNDASKELDDFFTALRAIFGKLESRPRGRLILSFRKEWLPEFEEQLQLRRLRPERLLLGTLQRAAVAEAVMGPTRSQRLKNQYGLSVEDGLAAEIADNLLADAESPVAPTLQILLTKMWQEACAGDHAQPRLTRELYQRLKRGGILLSDFLDQKLAEVAQWRPDVVESGLALDLLAFHTTAKGTAQQRTREELKESYPHMRETALEVVHRLGYLLADIHGTAREPVKGTRLAHDTLAPQVRERFEKSDRPGQRAARILESRGVEWSGGRTGALLDEPDLRIVEAGAEGMRAQIDDERRLVAGSREDVDGKLRRAERAAQVRRQLFATVLVVALFAVAAALVAGYFWNASAMQRDQARALLIDATAMRLTAEGQAMVAGVRPGGYLRGLLQTLAAHRLRPSVEPFSALQSLARLTSRQRWIIDSGAEVRAVAFSPDGARIVSGGLDTTLRLWDAKTGVALGEPLSGHSASITSVAFSPDGTQIVSGSMDNTLRLWNGKTGASIGEPMRGHSGQVVSVAFSPDGAHIVSGGRDATLRLWNVKTGAPIGEPLSGHSGQVVSVAFSPDGARIVSISGDGTLRLWDAKTRTAIGKSLNGYTGTFSGVAFSPDGARIVSGSEENTLRLWDAKTGAAIGKPLRGHSEEILSVAFSPDGMRIVSGSLDATLRLWDAKTGAAIGGPIRGHSEPINGVAFSPDGARIVSGSTDTTLRLWDVETETVIGYSLSGYSGSISSVAFSPDGARIVSGGIDQTLRLWDAKTGAAIGKPLSGHSDTVTSVAFSPDGACIVSGSDDTTLRLWNAKTGAAIGEPLSGHSATVTSVAFSPNGARIASGSMDQTLRLWDAKTGAAIGQPLRGHSDTVSSVAFSPNGARIVSGSWDKTLRLWDAKAGVAIGEPLIGHSTVNSVAFSPNGARIVSGSEDYTLRLWEANTGVAIGGPLKGHSGYVNTVTFSPDGAHIASGSEDHTLRLWDANTGAAIGEPMTEHSRVVNSVAFSPDGAHIASGSQGGTLRLWPVLGAWADDLCSKLTRNMTREEWRQWVSADISYRQQCPHLPGPPDEANRSAAASPPTHSAIPDGAAASCGLR